MIRMKVDIVGIDQTSMLPVVILSDLEGSGILPLVIGPAEASAISIQMENIKTPRPLTHDLFVTVIKKLKAQVLRVVVTDLVEDTYHAVLVVKSSGEDIEIDARPSDCIALALRFDAPIFISETLAEKAMVRRPEDDKDEEMESFRDFLDQISPDDFKRFRSD